MNIVPVKHAFYLHGFGSSARSAKAAFFADRLRGHGLTLRCPDFNEPDFESLTMTRMIGQVETAAAALGPGPVALIGSSLGAVVALHVAARRPERVDRLVLLAPAVTFARPERPFVSEDSMRSWRERGYLDVVHHAYGGLRPLAYAFHEDSLQYGVLAIRPPQPTLIFQGRRDEVVACGDVERYAASRSNVTLTLLDDDHQLLSSLPRIWDEMKPFFGLAG